MSLARKASEESETGEAASEAEVEMRKRRMFEVLEEIRASRRGLRMADNLPQEDPYGRYALR